MFTRQPVTYRASVTSAKLLEYVIIFVVITVTASQNAETQATAAATPAPIADPTIFVGGGNNSFSLQRGEAVSSEKEEEEGETKEGTEGKPAGAEGGGEEAEEVEETEGAKRGSESTGERPEAAGAGQEEAEEAEEAEAHEKEEAEGKEGADGANEALEDEIEDLVDHYRRQGWMASIEALQTRYPGINITADDPGEEGEMGEGLRGSETELGGKGKLGKYPSHQPPASGIYDYEVHILDQPKASYHHEQAKPTKADNAINPTRVQPPGMPNTQGSHAQLFDSKAGSNLGSYDDVARHSTGMTASATFGVVVGTILLSWLIVGPAVCLLWRWQEKRREKRNILLQRPHLHGSVDVGSVEGFPMSDLGKTTSRRQQDADVVDSLTRSRSELQSFPTTTTLLSQDA